jgi:hypothetical protein
MSRSDYWNPVMEAYLSLTPVGPYAEENKRWYHTRRPSAGLCVECKKQTLHWSDAFCQACARRIVDESRRSPLSNTEESAE